MSSRLLSPPRRRRGGCDEDHRAEPSVTSLSLSSRHPSKFPRATSMPALPPATAHVSPIRPSSPPPYDSFDQSGHHSQHQGETGSGSQPQHQKDSGSELELDSPPHIIFMTALEDEPGSPTSPYCDSPPSMHMKHAVSPTFGSYTDTQEHDFSDEEDLYSIAAADNTLPEDDPDDENNKVLHQRQSDLYARSALMHYNADEKNKVKYELISAITSCAIMDDKCVSGHVNFIAKGNQQNSKEELFFAELRLEGYNTWVPTCVVSLEGGKSVGGLCGTRYDIFDNILRGMPIDAQHCYACNPKMKHPKDGSLYESGHVACSAYYPD